MFDYKASTHHAHNHNGWSENLNSSIDIFSPRVFSNDNNLQFTTIIKQSEIVWSSITAEHILRRKTHSNKAQPKGSISIESSSFISILGNETLSVVQYLWWPNVIAQSRYIKVLIMKFVCFSNLYAIDWHSIKTRSAKQSTESWRYFRH